MPTLVATAQAPGDLAPHWSDLSPSLIYPDGMHATIAEGIREHLGPGARVTTAIWVPGLPHGGRPRQSNPSSIASCWG